MSGKGNDKVKNVSYTEEEIESLDFDMGIIEQSGEDNNEFWHYLGETGSDVEVAVSGDNLRYGDRVKRFAKRHKYRIAWALSCACCFCCLILLFVGSTVVYFVVDIDIVRNYFLAAVLLSIISCIIPLCQCVGIFVDQKIREATIDKTIVAEVEAEQTNKLVTDK